MANGIYETATVYCLPYKVHITAAYYNHVHRVYIYSVKVKVASSQGASLDLQIRFVEIRFSRNAILDTSFIQLYICIRSKISVLQFLVTHIEYGDTNGTS